jgi:branched-chain amino acid transport system ATP-binding protein
VTATETPGAGTGQLGRPPSLAVEHVSVRFGGLTALDDVNLAAAPGEIVGLIGPNGAGKTTLLNVITGLIRPQAGTVSLAGRPVGRASVHQRARRGLARTFQRVTLFEELSVGQHVQLAAEAARGWLSHPGAGPATPSAAPEAELTSIDWSGKVDAAVLLERLGLRVGTGAAVDGLPLGNARLVELAMALATRPVVLLLDEPFSGLAATERQHLSDLLLEVRAETDVAVVLVEHDVDIVSRIADRVVVLDFGVVIGDGPPEQVLADPAVRQAYFGMAGMGEP